MQRSFNKLVVFGAILFSGLVAMGCSDGTSTATTSSGTAGQGGTGGEGGNVGGAGGAGGSATFCKAGETQDCYSGPAGTEGVGVCKKGTQTCLDDGSAFGACEGEVIPATETCATIEDEDCDGMANEEGEGCICVPGTMMACYTGPMNTEGVGLCKGGMQTCKADGTGYDTCMDEVVPAAETCASTDDEDCDGAINEEGEGCVCVPGTSEPCYTGPMGTAGVGICAMGSHTCKADGTGYDACMGEVLPGVETCMSGGDEDCDGMANEEGTGCICVPGTTMSCYSGPMGTVNVGRCKSGMQTCDASGTVYGACMGEVLPAAETCDTPEDDDCNGMTNEGGANCVCLPNSTAPCYTGPMGTQGVGICAAGTQTCNAQGTALGACVGQVLPGTETCNTPVDDDCDGSTNENGAGCVCVPNSTAPCYTGPMGTQGVGICAAGTQTCNAQGTALGMCTGQVLPAAMENCSNAIDDNCDGQVNEGCAPTSCIGGAPNGTCNPFETCSCADCTADASCQATCDNDGTCTFSDDCVCAECATDAFCTDPANCNNDGVCAPFTEGCGCADCATNPSCAGGVTDPNCLGNVQNATCEAFESCACGDCTADAACQSTCDNDGTCEISDDCVCDECDTNSFCSDPANCNNDGVCDPFNEGCVCADCATNPACIP